jgi:hypothetical protein
MPQAAEIRLQNQLAHCKNNEFTMAQEIRVQNQLRTPPMTANNNRHQCKNQIVVIA